MKFGKILSRVSISAALILMGMASAMTLTFGVVGEFNKLFAVSVALLIAGHVLLHKVKKEEE